MTPEAKLSAVRESRQSAPVLMVGDGVNDVAALAAAFLFAFINSVRRGQYDDLDTPPLRMLFDDGSHKGRTP